MEVSIMVAVKEFSWEEVSSPDFGARAAWREAVATIAEKAKAKLPECNGRVDKAVALVLAGDVELLPDGTAKVASQSNGTTAYHVVNGHCDCRDYEKAPHNYCKHRLSAAIARRAQELTKAKLADTNGQATPPHSDTPVETPQSVPAQYITYLHGKPFVRYAGLLALAHERGLVSLKARLMSVTAELALAEAEAIFADSTLQNVPQHSRPHFPRMALTRC